MSTYIFLRHGESEGVQQNILQGHVDLPLTDAGRAQIRDLAECWRSSQQSFERIISSPLKRADETSRIIASALGITEIQIEPLWIERDFGKGEGMELKEVQEWRTTGVRPTAFEPIFGTRETEWQVHLRAGRAVEKLIALREGKYLIVSHGNILNAALHVILELLPMGRSAPVEMALGTGCYAKLRY